MKFNAKVFVEIWARYMDIHVELTNDAYGIKTHWRTHLGWHESEDDIEEKMETFQQLLESAEVIKYKEGDHAGAVELKDCIKLPKFTTREEFIENLDTCIEITELWLERRENIISALRFHAKQEQDTELRF